MNQRLVQKGYVLASHCTPVTIRIFTNIFTNNIRRFFERVSDRSVPVFGRPADERLLRTQHRLAGLREARKNGPAEEHKHALRGHPVELANQHGEGADRVDHGVDTCRHGHAHHEGVEEGEHAGGAGGGAGGEVGCGVLEDAARGG